MNRLELGSKYQISGSYRMGVFHIGYRKRSRPTRPIFKTRV